VDIYQALTEERPYRKALSHKKSVGLMQKMAGQNLIDASIVEDIGLIFPQQINSDSESKNTP
jgi:HD-GYP domain-containing protein (c-di-GMP phosphodiesterase class II)